MTRTTNRTKPGPLLWLCWLLAGLFWLDSAAAEQLLSAPDHAGPSLWGASGNVQTPSARVLPDWTVRLGAARLSPYTNLSATLGLFDRAEVWGRLSEVDTIEPFGGQGFGDYKDRAAGLKLVLVQEDGWWPQLAVGADDVTGTGVFASRYLATSRRIFGLDLTFGLGQGTLAGQAPAGRSVAEAEQAKGSFVLSDLNRRTRPFAAVRSEIFPGLVASAEISSLSPKGLFGHPDEKAPWPVSLGLTWRPWSWLYLQGAWLYGRDAALAGGVELPLAAEGLFAWKAEPLPRTSERLRQRLYGADNDQAAEILAGRLAEDGFADVSVAVSDCALWIEAADTRYLSPARTLARLGRLADEAAPARLRRFYLNLTRYGVIVQSLATDRRHLRDYLESRQDKRGFLAFADLTSGHQAHRKAFEATLSPSQPATAGQDRFSFAVEPRLRTFVGNREGYLKTKGLLLTSGAWRPDSETLVAAELETTIFNQYDDVAFEPLEKDSARTDLVLYERMHGTRLAMLAYDRVVELGAGVAARAALGYFESAYAGFGAELFRFFDNGRLGAGLECEVVAKRSPDSNFGVLRSGLRTTAFANLYAMISPEWGVDAGLTVGRFLAGDFGARLTLRRTFDHVTVGAWYTVTDTSGFASQKNRGFHDKGVFIQIPFSIFSDHEIAGRFDYALTDFTRDPGQTVRQPRSLFPLTPESLPAATRANLHEMHRR